MKKKKYKSIVVDIDNTLTELQYTVDKITEVFNKEMMTEEEIFDFNFKKVVGLTKEEDKLFWDKHEKEIVENVPYVSERVEKVKELIDVDYLETIHIVSNRPKYLRKSTLQWLEDNNIKYTTLELIEDEYKEEVIRDKYPHVDAVFEDNPKVISGLREQPETKHIETWLVDYPYNRTTPADYIICSVSGEVTEHEKIVK